MNKVVSELQLTDTQTEQFHQVMKSQRDQRKRSRGQHRTELGGLLSGIFDEQKLVRFEELAKERHGQ